jgi:transformation/transcription domain-associated protein
MPKAWHLWGVYSDDMHTANPTDFTLAANAVSCYLQAASLYKSSKCRPLLNRVLWLLSMDDDPQTVGQMWDTYKGEHVYWYWITLVPQLLTSLSQREGRYAHQVLFNIAKNYPQVRIPI